MMLNTRFQQMDDRFDQAMKYAHFQLNMISTLTDICTIQSDDNQDIKDLKEIILKFLSDEMKVLSTMIEKHSIENKQGE